MNQSVPVPEKGRSHSRLQWQILVGFAAGLSAGLVVYATMRDAVWVARFIEYVTIPIGQLFLRLLFMLVLPLLVSALVVGIADMEEVRALKRVGLKTLVYTVAVSTIAVGISLAAVNLLQPGRGVDPEAARAMIGQAGDSAASIVKRSAEAKTGVDALIDIVPSNFVAAMGQNDILAVMFFSLVFGIGMLLVQTRGTRVLRDGFEGVFEVSMRLIGIVIRLAPLAIFCFVQPCSPVRMGPHRPACRLCRRRPAGAGLADVRRVSGAIGAIRA